MTKLSVNINKVATLRNSRGGNMPNVVKAAVDVQLFGAEGVTVHPRPDERHIRYQDVLDIRPIIKTEFNIEGYPSRSFIDLVKKVKPHQVTLVPDPPEALTSNAGWDTIKNKSFLQDVIAEFSEAGIRTSIFIDTNLDQIANAAATNTDRVELYTEPYATMFPKDRDKAVAPFVKAAEIAKKAGLKINAGHDLSLENLKFFSEHIPYLAEVSIGHALICDALYLGLEKTVKMYKEQLVK
ncbi:pyridoxine 5'-phosphate synthase [Plebeiibacterium marinum]|uniref:Pyridoxine 5'-phosphate synthase n=1 Tax=Plebeiibacterium marinum TaxID=2992111 RepID=A0AAE3MGN8_9BACT|nr:pyridoxine 5'-phosphate synthase [Plebeiobacterium marinum]MCW3807151.1 pyridoxine 5'-phosphate synthase [Plebeiobacterium marinum]